MNATVGHASPTAVPRQVMKIVIFIEAAVVVCVDAKDAQLLQELHRFPRFAPSRAPEFSCEPCGGNLAAHLPKTLEAVFTRHELRSELRHNQAEFSLFPKWFQGHFVATPNFSNLWP